MTIISELFNDGISIFKIRKKLMKRQKGLDQFAPKVGDMAPDFTLQDLTGTETITLSEFRGQKPVALIFGSYT
jgi:peroxiredoxin